MKPAAADGAVADLLSGIEHSLETVATGLIAGGLDASYPDCNRLLGDAIDRLRHLLERSEREWTSGLDSFERARVRSQVQRIGARIVQLRRLFSAVAQFYAGWAAAGTEPVDEYAGLTGHWQAAPRPSLIAAKL